MSPLSRARVPRGCQLGELGQPLEQFERRAHPSGGDAGSRTGRRRSAAAISSRKLSLPKVFCMRPGARIQDGRQRRVDQPVREQPACSAGRRAIAEVRDCRCRTRAPAIARQLGQRRRRAASRRERSIGRSGRIDVGVPSRRCGPRRRRARGSRSASAGPSGPSRARPRASTARRTGWPISIAISAASDAAVVVRRCGRSSRHLRRRCSARVFGSCRASWPAACAAGGRLRRRSTRSAGRP